MRMGSLMLLSFFIFGEDYQRFMDVMKYDIPFEQKTRERKYPRASLKTNQIYDLRKEVRNIGVSVKRM